MSKKSQMSLLILGLFITLGMVVGISYALWQVTLQQTEKNVITTGCFDVTFSDANPINLSESYPISDEEGKGLTPYEFTITNTCDSLASYQINLEILNTTTLTDLSYIRSSFNESTTTMSPKILTTNETVAKTLTDTTISYKLEKGYLNANESKTYNLRLWLDKNTPTEDTYMNKILESKVTIVTSYLEADTEIPIANFVTLRNETGVVVDASNSTDNKEIATYYYSMDGKNFISSKESSHIFPEASVEYGVGTNTISKLYSSQVKEVYVYVEDMLGNQSEIKKQVVGELVYDETFDNNLRYIGANPNNYVYFNCDDISNPTSESCEKWRIIGSFNNIDNGTGNKETRIKLIRNESIGEFSWDTSYSKINDGFGMNEWSEAAAMKLMNPGYESESAGGSLYWNRESGDCYSNYGKENKYCNFSEFGLKESANVLISPAAWYTGANGNDIMHNSIMIPKFYELERSSNTGKICTSGKYCTDTVERTTEWTGYVGLMYPSDYGYATSGGNTTDREKCLNMAVYSWNASKVSDCKTNNWLYKSGTSQWTISPTSNSSSARLAFYVNSTGNVVTGVTSANNTLLPALYLNANIKIVSGYGSIDSPFVVKNT